MAAPAPGQRGVSARPRRGAATDGNRLHRPARSVRSMGAMTDAVAALAAAPRPAAARPSPGVRAIARRLLRGGAGPADHLAARPRRPARCWPTTSRSPTRRRCSSRPTTTSPACCTPSGVAPRRRSASAQGPLDEAAARAGVAARSARTGDVFRGTPVRYWFDAELAEIFGVACARRRRPPTRSTTRSPSGWPRTPSGRARCSSASASRCWRPPTTRATTSPRTPRSPPTPRGPAGSSRPSGPTATWSRRARLAPTRSAGSARSADVDTGDYAGYVAALEERRRHFIAHGATSADHSHDDAAHRAARDRPRRRASTTPALAGDGHAGRGDRLPPPHGAGDGPDVVRRRAGDDAAPGRAPQPPRGRRRARSAPTPGTTSRCAVEFTDALRPLLERFGTHPGFHLVLFTLDETVFTRELARWPASTRRCTSARRGGSSTPRTPSAASGPRSPRPPGSRRTSGFVDDTRAFCSIPARHDMSRRLDAGYLAQLVAEHRLDEDEAVDTAVDLVDRPAARGLQAVSAPRAGRAAPARRRAAAPVRARPPRAGQLLPRPPGLVHRHARRRARLGDRRLHRPPRRARRRADRPGRAVHAGHPRPPTATASRSWARRPRPTRRPTTTPGWATSPIPDVRGGDHSPSPRPATSAAPTAAWTRRPEVRGRRRRAARATRARRAARRPAACVAGLARPPRAPTPDRSPSCPCDNLPDNGAVRGPRRAATSPRLVDPALADWIDEHVSLVTTMVDRITPETDAGGPRAPCRGAPGRTTRAGGHRAVQRVGAQRDFPAGRPALGGRRRAFIDDVDPVRAAQALAAQRRPLAARLRRSAARARDGGRGGRRRARAGRWLEQWWAEASAAPRLPARRRRGATAPRCSSASPTRGCGTALAQIAADGSQKLPVRILPVLRRERAAGRLPEGAVARPRRLGRPPARRRRAGQGRRAERRPARRRALTRPSAPVAALDPALADDAELVAAVRAEPSSSAAGPPRDRPGRAAPGDVVIGLDVGTTAAKAVAFALGSAWRRRDPRVPAARARARLAGAGPRRRRGRDGHRRSAECVAAAAVRRSSPSRYRRDARPARAGRGDCGRSPRCSPGPTPGRPDRRGRCASRGWPRSCTG